MVEDKLSFNRNFIEWYVEDLLKVGTKGADKNDKLEKIAKDLKGLNGSLEDLEMSILQRNKIIDLSHSRFKGK